MPDTSSANKRLQWWTEARFGMFIHWGLYAIPARGEWVMLCERIPKEEYARLSSAFRPGKFDADAWVALAREAGMKYMVLTTRHHDGFCLWDSQVSDFTAPKTAARRDFVAEYVEACRKAGMRVGFYYSLLDWRFPAYWTGPEKDPEGWIQSLNEEWVEFVDYVHAQVRELCTRYGKIDILWYDGGWPHDARDWRAKELNETVRDLQPDIIINNRSGLPEDLDTPEQHITAFARPWEACMTIDDLWWGYHPGDPNLKSSMQLVRNLVRCVSANGNFLLNIGPKSDGSIPAPFAARLKEIGGWLSRNGESVYGCGSSPFGQMHLGHVTARGQTVYLHVMYWPGTEMCAAGIKNRANRVRMLATGEEMPFEQARDRLFVRGLPKKSPDPIDCVFAIDIEGSPEVAEADFWK
ncbi:MAG: alpha-L-fucosidase [Armatimonadetes bacterium]|nr:alpha-L-fucosidase [Armatimonadota bacterium]